MPQERRANLRLNLGPPQAIRECVTRGMRRDTRGHLERPQVPSRRLAQGSRELAVPLVGSKLGEQETATRLLVPPLHETKPDQGRVNRHGPRAAEGLERPVRP